MWGVVGKVFSRAFKRCIKYAPCKRLQNIQIKKLTESLQNVHQTFLKRVQNMKTFWKDSRNVLKTYTKRSQKIHKKFKNVLKQNVFFKTERSLHTRFPTLVSPLGYTRFERFIYLFIMDFTSIVCKMNGTDLEVLFSCK
jgi:hypothetical protein